MEALLIYTMTLAIERPLTFFNAISFIPLNHKIAWHGFTVVSQEGVMESSSRVCLLLVITVIPAL